ncbi:MAG: hypothetical protein JXR91_14490 [Deltaproteobacteria bacterium]|nr:hypothetical protein [Deltaproteobacteria bacterium]
MRSATLFISIFFIFQLGCTAPMPASLKSLKSEIAGNSELQNIDILKGYAARSHEAFENRDYDLSRQFADLGLMELELERAKKQKDEIGGEVEDLKQIESIKKLEEQKLKSNIFSLEQIIARHDMLIHIENVIEKESLEAAAMEEASESKFSKEELKKIEAARELVSRELLSSARLNEFIIEKIKDRAGENSGYNFDEFENLKKSVTNCFYALNHKMITDVYRYSYDAEQIFNGLIDELYLKNGSSFKSKKESLLKDTAAAGLEPFMEKVGVAVKLDLSKKAIGINEKNTLDNIAAFMNSREDLILIIAVSGIRVADRPVALRQSVKFSKEISDYLQTKLNDNKTVNIFEIENQTPLKSLKGDKIRGVILFIPDSL